MRHILTLTLTALLTILTLACSPTQAQAPTAPDPYTTTRDATVVLRTAAGPAGCGGVRISPTEILTAYHCIHEEEMAYSTYADIAAAGGNVLKAASHSARVVDSYRHADLAILVTTTPGPYVLSAGSLDALDVIWTWHHTGLVNYQRTRGVFLGVAVDTELKIPFRIATLNIYKGASGCGVFDRYGRLVGIVSMVDRAQGKAILSALPAR